MSDKALSDAIAALAKSQLLTVDVLRETQSTTRVMAQRLGVLCDQNAEILKQLENLHSGHRESERAMRVVQDQMQDVFTRLEPLEKAHATAAAKPATRQPT